VQPLFGGANRLHTGDALASPFLVLEQAPSGAGFGLGKGTGREPGRFRSRERFFTPKLRVKSYDELNAWLLDLRRDAREAMLTDRDQTSVAQERRALQELAHLTMR
jgi:hypothetical protein